MPFPSPLSGFEPVADRVEDREEVALLLRRADQMRPPHAEPEARDHAAHVGWRKVHAEGGKSVRCDTRDQIAPLPRLVAYELADTGIRGTVRDELIEDADPASREILAIELGRLPPLCRKRLRLDVVHRALPSEPLRVQGLEQREEQSPLGPVVVVEEREIRSSFGGYVARGQPGEPVTGEHALRSLEDGVPGVFGRLPPGSRVRSASRRSAT